MTDYYEIKRHIAAVKKKGNNMSEEKNQQPQVAIVIPLYNDAEFLRNCLDSILAQTVPFWEAIMVNDCSTDDSVDIAAEYCAKDSRFRLYYNDVNSSAWVCRAKGILATQPSVKYIMFADADDTLTPQAVGKAYALMEGDPVDILHFGTNVINCAEISGNRLKSYNDYLKPVMEKLCGRQIFDSFVERNFEGHLWNKMFNAQLLREVIEKWGVDRVLPKAQDKVLYWAVCWHKDDLTYRGVPDRLYNYSYGLGVEGSNEKLDPQKFKQYLCQAWTEDTISEIMAEHPEAAAEYADTIELSRFNLIRHSIRNFLRLPEKVRPKELNTVVEYWNRPLDRAMITCALAEYTWDDQLKTSAMMEKADFFKTHKSVSDIHTIGTYYHRMDNGGIQRVISQLVSCWHDMGYNVVLFTDCEPTENDYPLPDYVKRVTIARPFSKCRNSNYHERGMSLARLLAENNVDCMVYHSYFSEVILYDMGICKALNVPFMIYVHNVFTRFIRYNDKRFALLPLFCRNADAMLALDKTSCRWWKCFNANTHLVLNPFTFDFSNIPPAPRDNHNILFLCRLEEEAKHPKDAVRIMTEVTKRFPDAQLFVVGSGNEKYLNELTKFRMARGMLNNVIMCGFDKEVEKYYESCSIFLSCSSHEGFMLTLCEAMSHSLPIVMYDLPYLPTVIGNDGIISVPQRDVEAAADAICSLLEDNDRLKAVGADGRRFLEKLYSTDIAAQWKAVFDSVGAPTDPSADPDCLMSETIVRDYYDGIIQFGRMSRTLSAKKNELNDIKNSLSFKVGRVITFIPRKLRDFVKHILNK